MVWQLLAMWTIVIVTITWFIRDEKHLRAEAALARAARYYAHAPKYRHVSVEPTGEPAIPPRSPTGGLNREQRAFLAALAASKPAAPESGAP